MSLILDALKKSEAERRRGLPPNLHAQFGTPQRSRRAPWAAGAGAVLLMAGLGSGWMWLARDASAPAPEALGPSLAGGDRAAGSLATAPLSESPIAVTSAVAVPVSVTVSSPGRALGEAAFGGVGDPGNGGTVSGGGLPVPERAGLYTPTTSPTTGVVSQPPPTAVAAPPVAAVALPEAVVPAMAEAIAKPVASSATPVAMATPVDPIDLTVIDQAATQPEPKLPLMYQLPYGTRKELPKLDLTMHVFSPVREECFIVLNGKRYTVESPAPGPELTLLDIVVDGVVLEFRGQRFLLPNQAY